MERRIKILNVFTIIAIAAFCIMQCWWLYARYKYTLQNYESELYGTISGTMAAEFDMRRRTPDPKVGIVTSSSITAGVGGEEGSSLTWMFDVYVVDGDQYPVGDSLDSERIVSSYAEQGQDGITKYRFIVSDSKNEADAYDALERFCVDEMHPFSTDRLERLLHERGIYPGSISTEHADSMMWNPVYVPHSSVLNPVMTVVWPYDILGREQVRITVPIGVSPIIMDMSGTLAVTLVLSILLVSCLSAQIATVRRQRRIEQLRVDFIHSMVHELKRPISTLKMCVSYMRNEKLMQDAQSRDAILTDSYNELDNLTAYFSKLRDLTYNDTIGIPLNISRFDLQALLNDCISKLNVPVGKEADIRIVPGNGLTISADRIYLANVVSNLLENSVKYSGNRVSVIINYTRESNGCISISVKDNGIGIPKDELRYVFDKFFRSRKVTDSGIPGMGLGLAYVRMLVRSHGGTISVRSMENSGSVFIIILPQEDMA